MRKTEMKGNKGCNIRFTKHAHEKI